MSFVSSVRAAFKDFFYEEESLKNLFACSESLQVRFLSFLDYKVSVERLEDGRLEIKVQTPGKEKTFYLTEEEFNQVQEGKDVEAMLHAHLSKRITSIVRENLKDMGEMIEENPDPTIYRMSSRAKHVLTASGALLVCALFFRLFGRQPN